MDFKGQVVLVTGSSRGIGAATAKLFAEYGASVTVNYFKSKEKAEKVISDIKSKGGKAIAVQADCRDGEQVNAMVKKTVDELGPIDILVLNAGMSVPYKLFVDMTYEEFENKVLGEAQCFFFPLKPVIPSMIERGKGCIIGISSGLSRTASPNFSAHTMIKSGIDGLMKSLAVELGPHGIRVNTVSPGLTMTDATSWMPKERVEMMAGLTPLRRVAQPEDVAGAVVMVASGNAGFVTGNYISTSGGTLMV